MRVLHALWQRGWVVDLCLDVLTLRRVVVFFAVLQDGKPLPPNATIGFVETSAVVVTRGPYAPKLCQARAQPPLQSRF